MKIFELLSLFLHEFRLFFLKSSLKQTFEFYRILVERSNHIQLIAHILFDLLSDSFERIMVVYDSPGCKLKCFVLIWVKALSLFWNEY